MLKSDIIEVLGCEIERKIGGEWKHEVNILGVSSVHLNFEIDEKEFVLVVYKIEEGEHFSDYFKKTKEEVVEYIEYTEEKDHADCH